MADALPGFDPAVFRDRIRFAMNMGLPQTLADRPTFYFRAVRTFPVGTRLDSEGSPLDPRIAPVSTAAPNPVQVPCAVEFKADNSDNETIVGTFRDTTATLTLLDVDYALVADAIEVALGQQRYNIGYAAPPLGLGQATVYQLFCFPKGEDRP